jgi:transcriptional regulator with XRE-family HTH domain
MTQEKLGELVGVSYQQVQKYEKGTSKLSPERIQQVAAALAVPMQHLFGEERGEKAGLTNEEGVSYGEAAPQTPEEREILRQFRRLGSPADRSLLLFLIKALVKYLPRSSGPKC